MKILLNLGGRAHYNILPEKYKSNVIAVVVIGIISGLGSSVQFPSETLGARLEWGKGGAGRGSAASSPFTHHPWVLTEHNTRP